MSRPRAAKSGPAETGKGRQRARATRFGIFVEGAHHRDARGRDPLVDLWHHLAGQHAVAEDAVAVHGFSKGHILKMAPSGPTLPSTEPLDVRIARAYDASPFDVLIIAWDAVPANQDLIVPGCLAETRYVIELFLKRRYLPAPFLADAGELLQHYAHNPRPVRRRAYAPRLDALYMNPMFEALVVSDEVLVKAAFGVKRAPKGWPAFHGYSKKPDREVLGEALGFASDEVRRRVRGDIRSNKHGWALEIARHATDSANTTFHAHNIMRRLGAVLTPNVIAL